MKKASITKITLKKMQSLAKNRASQFNECKLSISIQNTKNIFRKYKWNVTIFLITHFVKIIKIFQVKYFQT